MIYLVVWLLCLVHPVFACKTQMISVLDVLKTKLQVAAMVAKDQTLRSELMELVKLRHGNLSADIVEYWQEVDRENSEQLQSILAKWGWLRPPVFEQKYNDAMWLLAQHADGDLELQKNCLKELVKCCHTKKEQTHYGYLYDRIRIHEHQPQLFGTQGMCIKKHIWQPFAIVDVSNLNRRRMAIGLPSFMEYQAIMNQLCP